MLFRFFLYICAQMRITERTYTTMKRFLSILTLIAVVTSCTKADLESTTRPDDISSKIINTTDCAIAGKLLVKLNRYTPSFNVECDITDIEARPVVPIGKATDAEIESEELYRWWVLSFSEDVNIEHVAEAIAANSLVQYVEYNTELERIDSGDENSRDDSIHSVTRAIAADMPFNDEYLCEQWHYYNDGTVYGDVSSDHRPGADINLFPAWKYCTGDNRVIVAVIDGGVKYDHPDLAANMWVNEAEKNGSARVDDDNNGYTDDIYGFNFNDDNGNITFDDHGTHVAGTIAAVSNNGIGVAGIAGGSGKGDGCRIMTCQIYKNGEATSTENIAAAIKYAADNGAVIINNSWQYAKGSYTSDSRFRQNYSVLMDAIKYFESNAKLPGVIDGGICIFAAGNDAYGFNFNDDNGNITFDDHGTHVAGTIAAVSNNGIGVAGIAGGSGKGDGCRIMTCQIYKNGEATSTENIAAAIKYAADNGAVIINNSWQYAKGSYTSDSRFRQNYSVLMDAIKYFESNAKLPGVIDGGICIFAAGNDAYNVPSYPGAYYSNICVTAFGPNFTAGSYTNYGAGANICAPGGENTSWATKICSTSVEYEVNYEKGTSMAAPHVSGCAALGLSYALKIGKSFTRDEFKDIILTSVHDIDQYQTERKGAFDFDTGTYPTVNIEYYKGLLGSGYIDAHLLLMQVEGTPCLYVAKGKETALSLDNYFGDASEKLTYTNVTISAEDMTKLGINSAPTVVDGKLHIKCGNSGTARISVTAIVGGTVVGGGDNMGGMEVTRTFELVVRRATAPNGGWL